MRLLVVGSDEVYAIENFYEKYLCQQGVEIELFPAQRYFYEYYHVSLINKLVYRLGLSRILQQINQQLRETIERFKPQVIWVFKGMEILPETLQWAKERKIILINYNPDNPFIFSGSGSGNKNVIQSVPLYDLHFTYNHEIKNKLEKEFHARTAFLPFGFDVSEELYEKAKQQPEIQKVCFLGNPDKGRAAYLLALLDRGIPIDVYGNAWDKFLHHKNLAIHAPVYGDELLMVLARYRVQLNLLRIHNEQSHNMRTFEVPGIGAIQLAPDTPEHRRFFTPDVDIFLYRDVEECVIKIQYLLQLSPQQAANIRQRSRQKVVSAGYSYKDRAAQALQVIQTIFSANEKM